MGYVYGANDCLHLVITPGIGSKIDLWVRLSSLRLFLSLLTLENQDRLLTYLHKKVSFS